MAKKDNGITRPIDAFVQHFLDIKPYHTKILEVVERYKFSESMDVSISAISSMNVIFSNDPLCKPVGFGISFDDGCGFASVSCCDLFDCIGGYGLIFDNSDLLVSAPITSRSNEEDWVTLAGNYSYDAKAQVLAASSDTFRVAGDLTSLLAVHNLIVVAPFNVFTVLSSNVDSFTVAGNHATELLNKKEFNAHGTGENDGSYSVVSATYDIVLDRTTLVVSQELTGTSTTGFLEVYAPALNMGAYLVKNVTFDGTDTSIEVHTETGLMTSGAIGAVQFRTGLTNGRHIWMLDAADLAGPEREFTVVDSEYDLTTNTTKLTVAENLNVNTDAIVHLYGYMTAPGFDNSEECSAPKPYNISVVFSETLSINIVPVPSMTPTPTITPTNTPTPTPTIVPSPTPTVTPSPSPVTSPLDFTYLAASTASSGTPDGVHLSRSASNAGSFTESVFVNIGGGTSTGAGSRSQMRYRNGTYFTSFYRPVGTSPDFKNVQAYDTSGVAGAFVLRAEHYETDPGQLSTWIYARNVAFDVDPASDYCYLVKQLNNGNYVMVALTYNDTTHTFAQVATLTLPFSYVYMSDTFPTEHPSICVVDGKVCLSIRALKDDASTNATIFNLYSFNGSAFTLLSHLEVTTTSSGLYRPDGNLDGFMNKWITMSNREYNARNPPLIKWNGSALLDYGTFPLTVGQENYYRQRAFLECSDGGFFLVDAVKDLNTINIYKADDSGSAVTFTLMQSITGLNLASLGLTQFLYADGDRIVMMIYKYPFSGGLSQYNFPEKHGVWRYDSYTNTITRLSDCVSESYEGFIEDQKITSMAMVSPSFAIPPYVPPPSPTPTPTPSVTPSLGSFPAAAFDPATKDSQMTLSNGNLTVSSLVGINNINARTNSVRSSGKYCFEFVVDAYTGTHWVDVGLIATASEYHTTQYIAEDAIGFGFEHGVGQTEMYPFYALLPGDTSPNWDTIVYETLAIGSVVQICVDLDNKKAWYKVNTAAGYAGGGDPASGTSPTIPRYNTPSAMVPAVDVRNMTLTFRFKASQMTMVIPTGFTAWEGASS